VLALRDAGGNRAGFLVSLKFGQVWARFGQGLKLEGAHPSSAARPDNAFLRIPFCFFCLSSASVIITILSLMDDKWGIHPMTHQMLILAQY
jgi:hypothetical protein